MFGGFLTHIIIGFAIGWVIGNMLFKNNKPGDGGLFS